MTRCWEQVALALQLIGLLASTGTPKPIVAQVAQAMRTALADWDFQRF
jgi:tripartite-type tricarboxylate transporter receptor subunit TctC